MGDGGTEVGGYAGLRGVIPPWTWVGDGEGGGIVPFCNRSEI